MLNGVEYNVTLSGKGHIYLAVLDKYLVKKNDTYLDIYRKYYDFDRV